MESTTTDSMCRCCAAEGIFKDIKTSYHWMGEEEVYGDMLRECFDVKLATIEEGGICEVCISQLRNAANFKKQVLHTEKKFKRYLESRRFKPTEVKEELSGDNGNSSDDDRGAADSEEDEDYVPEFEIPIKTESPEESKSRKRTAKASTSRAKKSRVADEDKSVDIRDHKTINSDPEVSFGIFVKVEDTSCADNNPKSPEANKVPSKKKTSQEDVQKLSQRNKLSSVSSVQLELEKHRYNIRKILQCSNATPIRKHYVGSGYICCFCEKHFFKASDLKNHTLRDHDDKTKNKFMQATRGLANFKVYFDITLLSCKVCGLSLDTLEQLIGHLNHDHQKGLHTEIKSRIACFKLDGEAMKCHICSKEFNSFKNLQAHMNTHFSNYICDVCGAGFITQTQLGLHSDIHRMGTHKCDGCEKVFSSLSKLKSHERKTHIAAAARYRCYYCSEKFKYPAMKKNHMIKSHGVEYADLKCDTCDRTFKNSRILQAHRRKDHLMIRYPCKLCDT